MKMKILLAASLVLCLALTACGSLIYSNGARNVFLNCILETGRTGIVSYDTAQRWTMNAKRWLESGAKAD
jgi:hypothetical protein